MNVAEAELTHTEELARAERPPRIEKVEEVERLKGVLTGAAGIYLTDFRGINVEKMNDLRLRFREAGVEYTIVKNNLLKRAAADAGLEGWVDDLVGPTAMAVGREDPVAPAKVIKGFQDDNRRAGDFLEFKGGLLQGEAIEVSTFKRLAALPGHDELIARLLFMLTYPMRGLVTVLSAVPGKLVYALDDLRRKRAAEEPVEEPAAEEPVEEPAAEEPVEEPAAEEPVEEPAAEEPVEEPAAEEPVEEPAAAEEVIEDSAADEAPAKESAEEAVETAPSEDRAEEPVEDSSEEQIETEAASEEETSADGIESGEQDEPDREEE